MSIICAVASEFLFVSICDCTCPQNPVSHTKSSLNKLYFCLCSWCKSCVFTALITAGSKPVLTVTLRQAQHLCILHKLKIVCNFLPHMARLSYRIGGKMSHDWSKIPHLSVRKRRRKKNTGTHTYTQTHHDFSHKSEGHILVSPLSDRFLIFRLCRSWRTDWNWNSLH